MAVPTIRLEATITWLTAIVLIVTACGESDGTQGRDWEDVPEIVSFLEQEWLPDGASERLRDALDRGGLAPDPDTFHLATSSLLADCETRCVGTLEVVRKDSVVVTSVETGSEWTVAIDSRTRISRGGAQIELSDLESGEFVEVLRAEGGTAMLILSFSEPLGRRPRSRDGPGVAITGVAGGVPAGVAKAGPLLSSKSGGPDASPYSATVPTTVKSNPQPIDRVLTLVLAPRSAYQARPVNVSAIASDPPPTMKYVVSLLSLYSAQRLVRVPKARKPKNAAIGSSSATTRMRSGAGTSDTRCSG